MAEQNNQKPKVPQPDARVSIIATILVCMMAFFVARSLFYPSEGQNMPVDTLITSEFVQAVEQGRVIAAGKLGKIKTTCQITMIITHLVYLAQFPLLHILAGWLLIPTQIAALGMTLWSGWDYLVHNKEVLHG